MANKKRIAIVTTLTVLCCAAIYFWRFTNVRELWFYKGFGKWQVTSNAAAGDLPWIDFFWEGDSLGRKWYPEAAMFVPVKIDGSNGRLACQFDIGADITLIYGNPLKSLVEKSPALKQAFRLAVYHKDTTEYLADMELKAGDVSLRSPKVMVKKDYGPFVNDSASGNEIQHIGTLGVDICQNKVLIIDYPRRRLCIADTIPAQYRTGMTDIELDRNGRPVLRMMCRDREYSIAFDCGSSTFPLLMRPQAIDGLSAAVPDDTADISAWGRSVRVFGRPMKNTFILAGQKFWNKEVYVGEAGSDLVPRDCDGLTGNILFLDKVVVVDFRHRQIGTVDGSIN